MKIKTYLIEVHIIKIKSNEEIEYLLLKRASNQKYPDIWQMVTGKINDNETAYQAALREIKEETNLKVKHLYIVPNINSFYDSLNDSITHVPVFVAVVNSDVTVEISKEHSEYKWVEKNEAGKLLAWPGQEKSVKFIEQYFSKKKKNLNFIQIL